LKLASIFLENFDELILDFPFLTPSFMLK
jgi:hypothetical protein